MQAPVDILSDNSPAYRRAFEHQPFLGSVCWPFLQSVICPAVPGLGFRQAAVP